MQPQELAKKLLPAALYRTLHKYATAGCPADCGPDWSPEAIEAAIAVGPHVKPDDVDNIALLWEDILYQQDAGFIRVVKEADLFGPDGPPPNLKISRVAVVPQVNRRGRIILNLSADVDLTKRKRRKLNRTAKHKTRQPSVNETTEPAANQEGVKALGTAMLGIMEFMFDTDCDWEIDWHKIDLSDGFWRMIVEHGAEYNFCYQLPRREGDTEDHFVVPNSLQMGWKNSPAYFCEATETVRTLVQRILALTHGLGIVDRHRHEKYLFDLTENQSGEVTDDEDEEFDSDTEWDWDAICDEITILERVFVDDFMGGIAGPRGRDPKRKRAQFEWVGRACLHAIHAVFPPPEVLKHKDGKDSVSVKKCEKGDARWKRYEILLGFGVAGEHGPGRCIGLPKDKKDKYVNHVQDALSKPKNFMLFGEFQKLHGKLQHATVAMPSMRGFMTPLNRILKQEEAIKKNGGHVGLSPDNPNVVRETLEDLVPLLEASYHNPSHITELVGPDLPHYYGYVDACAGGVGGVWLPSTRWLQPIVWRVPWPEDIRKEVQKEDGTVNNNDVEAAAVFIAECLLDDYLGGDTAGVSSYLGSDNTSTVSWNTRAATRCTHRAPERFIRWKALRQRWTRRGPQDVDHVAGKDNLLGDIPSRSYDKDGETPQFLASQDNEFLTWFNSQFPLPQQLGCWQLVQPRTEIVFAATSLLRNNSDSTIHPATCIGTAGVALPTTLANTLGSLTSKAPASTWNEATCSWPLLSPSGRESTTEVAARCRERQSRRRFAGARSAWSPEDLRTLGAQIRPSIF